MSAGAITAEFIDSKRGRILALAHHPKSFDGRCLLVVPPFAEEMNKSRRMFAELAQRLVARGIGVIIPDYFGTGDSEGDFADTDCEAWFDDLAATEAWVLAKGWSISAILGVRLGCMVAAVHARRRSTALKLLVFWQPVLDGARSLDQFLRMRVAASLMDDQRETVVDLKAKFATGETVTVAGYGLSPRLAEQLERLKLAPILAGLLEPRAAIHWFEVLRSTEATIPIPTTKTIDELQRSGCSIQLQTVVSEPFWASTEIVCSSRLLDASTEIIVGGTL